MFRAILKKGDISQCLSCNDVTVVRCIVVVVVVVVLSENVTK
jgi:hypothetical protein